MAIERENLRELDLAGLKCPLPALRTRRALLSMQHGDRMHVIATDPLAAIDIPHALTQSGDVLEKQEERDGALHFVIRRVVGA